MSALASFWVVILATFLDFAKKAQPYENVVNSSRIEGGGASENNQKASQTPEKKRYENEDENRFNFDSMLASFWRHLEQF